MFCKLENGSKWSTVIGIFLMAFPIGLQWYWGNMSTYVYSYIIKYHPEYDDINSLWLISVFLIALNSGIFVTGIISNRIRKRLMAVFGIVMFNAGLVSSYFAIKSIPILLNLTLGVVFGLGCGIIFSCGMTFTLEWATKDVGLLTSVFLCSYNVGSILVNQVTSYYINPFNEMPDISRDSSKFFSNNSVVDRVPFLFLLIGICASVSQVIGLGLIRVKNHDGLEQDSENTILPTHPQEKFEKENENSKLVECNGDQGKIYIRKDSTVDYSPKQVLKCRHFYVLSLGFMLCEYSYILIVNYYKAFGILKVGNDHFYTNMASVMVLCAAIARVLSGYIMDRIGVKRSMIGISVILGVGIAFIFFSAMLGKWVYGVLTVFLASISCAQFGCFIIATVTIFGSQNASANVGMLLTAGSILNLIAPALIKYLLYTFGWFSLFISGSLLILTGLIVIICFLPNL